MKQQNLGQVDVCSLKCINNRYNILTESETECFRVCLAKSRNLLSIK
jgi:hypothetical protein